MLPAILGLLVLMLFVEVTDFLLRLTHLLRGLRAQRVVSAYFEERLDEWAGDDDDD